MLSLKQKSACKSTGKVSNAAVEVALVASRVFHSITLVPRLLRCGCGTGRRGACARKPGES